MYGSHFAEDFEDAAAYGWTVEAPRFDWPTLRDNKTREIERLNGSYRNLLESAGVEIIRGFATLRDRHTIEIDSGRTVTAERILIATGGWPRVPEFPGREHVITSNEAFYLEEFPERVIVVGGGYIAVEFAGIFAGLGAATTLVHRGALFLRGFDDGVRAFVADQLREKHIDLKFDATVARVELTRNGARRVVLADGRSMDADLVLFATGRSPTVRGIGLEAAGVALTARGSIAVDDRYRTNVDNIYAIGDVIDRVQLTPVAIAEGMVVADNLFNGKNRTLDYAGVPTAVFCQPNIGTVGLTEAQAREQYANVRIFESTLPADETHDVGTQRAHHDEVGSRRRHRSCRGRAHGRSRRRRDHSGARRCVESRRHEGPVRFDDRNSSDGCRGIRNDARGSSMIETLFRCAR